MDGTWKRFLVAGLEWLMLRDTQYRGNEEYRVWHSSDRGTLLSDEARRRVE